MTIVGWDTETHLIAPGQNAPKIVCVTWDDGTEARIATGKQIEEALVSLFEQVSGGHNIVYDAACALAHYPETAPYIHKALVEGRLLCSQQRQTLIDIAEGIYASEQELEDGTHVKLSYNLDAVAYRLLKKRKGKDTYRLRYAELEDVPVEQWPEEALHYALEDARLAREVLQEQEKDAEFLDFQANLMRSEFALQLVQCWGILTDSKAIKQLKEAILSDLAVMDKVYRMHGFVRKDGRENQKAVRAAVEANATSLALKPKLTNTGATSIGKDNLNLSQNHLLIQYATYKSHRKILGTDLKMLERGEHWPIHAGHGITVTLRGSSFKPNLQNLSKVKVQNRYGVRECIKPRDGKVFVSADYSQLEMCTLAQTLIQLGIDSELPDAINKGLDCHIILACEIHGWDYEWAIAQKKSAGKKNRNDWTEEEKLVDFWRQGSKAGNYGFGGGMGVAKFLSYATQYGAFLTQTQAADIRQAFIDKWNMRPFFKQASDATRYNRLSKVQLPGSKRWRGGCTYTEHCNFLFQGPGADIGRESTWRIAEACYFSPGDILFGSKNVLFTHDSNDLEVPEERAHESALRVQELMLEAARQWLPDITPAVDVLVTRRLSKDAKKVTDEKGRYVPWEPTSY